MDPLARLAAVESGWETSLKWWWLIRISGLVSGDYSTIQVLILSMFIKTLGKAGAGASNQSFFSDWDTRQLKLGLNRMGLPTPTPDQASPVGGVGVHPLGWEQHLSQVLVGHEYSWDLDPHPSAELSPFVPLQLPGFIFNFNIIQSSEFFFFFFFLR